MKKAMINASTASMIYQFNMENIAILEKLGYIVEVSANFEFGNSVSDEKIQDFKRILNDKNIKFYNTSCPRNIFAFKDMWDTYKFLKQLADKENYDLVHTQSPIGGVLCRLAFRKARKRGTKVIYTAHGFHFCKGAPLKNRLLYYPAEKLCSYFTDVLITINKEDHEFAKKKMKAKKIYHIHGVGIDLRKYSSAAVNKAEKRKELDIPDGAVWVLAVGELIRRKNHEALICAVSNFDNVYLTIAGKGELHNYLKKLTYKLNISDRVKLLGFRTDISELCGAADIFAFPSLQEGLPVALMEAMACGLPIACSRIRGNVDLIDENKGGVMFAPKNIDDAANALNKLLKSDLKDMVRYNAEKIKKFDLERVKNEMKRIYETEV